jgi:hypothetical protein
VCPASIPRRYLGSTAGLTLVTVRYNTSFRNAWTYSPNDTQCHMPYDVIFGNTAVRASNKELGYLVVTNFSISCKCRLNTDTQNCSTSACLTLWVAKHCCLFSLCPSILKCNVTTTRSQSFLYQPRHVTDRACAVVRLTAVTADDRQGRDTACTASAAVVVS